MPYRLVFGLLAAAIVLVGIYMMMTNQAPSADSLLVHCTKEYFPEKGIDRESCDGAKPQAFMQTMTTLQRAGLSWRGSYCIPSSQGVAGAGGGFIDSKCGGLVKGKGTVCSFEGYPFANTNAGLTFFIPTGYTCQATLVYSQEDESATPSPNPSPSPSGSGGGAGTSAVFTFAFVVDSDASAQAAQTITAFLRQQRPYSRINASQLAFKTMRATPEDLACKKMPNRRNIIDCNTEVVVKTASAGSIPHAIIVVTSQVAGGSADVRQGMAAAYTVVSTLDSGAPIEEITLHELGHVFGLGDLYHIGSRDEANYVCHETYDSTGLSNIPSFPNIIVRSENQFLAPGGIAPEFLIPWYKKIGQNVPIVVDGKVGTPPNQPIDRVGFYKSDRCSAATGNRFQMWIPYPPNRKNIMRELYASHSPIDEEVIIERMEHRLGDTLTLN